MPIHSWHLIPACLALVALLGGGYAAGSAVGASSGHPGTQLFVRTVRMRAAQSTVTTARAGPTTTVRATGAPASGMTATAGSSTVDPTTVTAAPTTRTELLTGPGSTVTETSVVTTTSTITTTETVPTTVTVTTTATHGHS